MAKEDVSEAGSQPTPGKGGKAGPIVFISLTLILAAAGGGGYLLVSHLQQRDDKAESSEKKGSAADKEKETDQNDRFEKEQRRRLLRAGLQEFVEKGNVIRQDIDALEKDIDTYEQRLEELMDSDVAKRLVENSQALRYLYEGRLGVPHGRTMVRDFRARLDLRTYSAEEALSKADGAFAVSKEMREAVDSIRRDVDEARKEYTRHRLLLDGFMKSVTEKEDGDPEVREDGAASERERLMLEGLLGNVGGNKQDAEHPGQEKAVKDNGGAMKARTPTRE